MTVERIVIVGDKSSKVYVTLTDAELYAAYNEQKLRFLLSDAQDRLREYCGLDGDMETNLDYEFNGLRLLLFIVNKQAALLVNKLDAQMAAFQ